MKYLLLRLKRFCGFLTGIVFFLSGFFKLLDPVGAALVMDGYFDFLHLSFMSPLSKILATILALTEAIVGTALITGVWRRLSAFTACILQGFFTLITIILVIFNPEMDCGCFGEVIHLTHWQTLFKNIILCALLAGYTIPTRALGGPKQKKYVSFGTVSLSLLAFTVYSWISIPMIDFTDFKPASILQSAENSSETGSYDAVFVYEKNGLEESFSIEALPDSTWSFVRTETIEKEQEETGSISLSLYDKDGNYHDGLASAGKVMVVSIYDAHIKDRKWMEISEFLSSAEETGFKTLVLAGCTEYDINSEFSKLDSVTAALLQDRLYYSDYKTLITLNRSNGGVTYFCDGILSRKWSARTRPDMEKMEEIEARDAIDLMAGYETRGSLTLQGFLLYVFAIMLLL